MNLDDAYTEFLTNQVAPPPPPPVPEPQPKPDGFHKDMPVGDYLSTVFTTLGDIPDAAVRGALKGLGETIYGAGLVDDEQIKKFRSMMDATSQLAAKQGVSPTATGLVEDVSQIAPAAVPAFKVFKGLGMARSVAAILAEGIGGALGYNPDDPNLGNLLEGLIGKDSKGALAQSMKIVADGLATNPEDPTWQNRARNFAQDAGIGFAFEGIFKAIKASPNAARSAAAAAKTLIDYFNDTAKAAQQGTAFSGIPTRPDVPLQSGSELSPIKDDEGVWRVVDGQGNQMALGPAGNVTGFGDEAAALKAIASTPSPQVSALIDPAPVFYSAVANAVDALPMEKGNAAQMRAMIAKGEGVKAEEMAWIGLDDFLAGKKSVTKQEIKEFVDANQVRIEEVVKAGDYPQRTGDEWQALIMQAERRQDFGEAERLTAEWEAAEGFGDPGSPKFSDYTLPGGENYREVLLRLPSNEPVPITKLPDGYEVAPLEGHPTAKYTLVGPSGVGSPVGGSTLEEATDQAIERLSIDPIYRFYPKSPEFTGGHYDESNVLAHMRLNDRTGPNGEKILFVEEIQSDWHQKARDIRKIEIEELAKRENITEEEAAKRVSETIGYADPERIAELKARRAEILKERDVKWKIQTWWPRLEELADKRRRRSRIEVAGSLDGLTEAEQKEYISLIRKREAFDKETATALKAIDSEIASRVGAVPDAPLKKVWHEMAFRRIARMAAEKGYDAIAWTPGKVQAERYDLSKQISEVHWSGSDFKAYDLDGATAISRTGVRKEDLPGLIGKEAAEKLIAQEKRGSWRSLTGVDLQVGGEGMKGFYDKMLKGYAAKWGKKFGAKVGVTRFTEYSSNPDDYSIWQGNKGSSIENDWFASSGAGETRRFGSREEAEAYVEEVAKGGTQVWTLPITKKMRDSVLSKGVATFGVAGVAAGLNQQEARPNGN